MQDSNTVVLLVQVKLPLEVGTQVECRFRDGAYRLARIIERRVRQDVSTGDYEYYVHYDKRERSCYAALLHSLPPRPCPRLCCLSCSLARHCFATCVPSLQVLLAFAEPLLSCCAEDAHLRCSQQAHG